MKDYKKIATKCRKKVLEMIHRGQTSHIASNFSVIDIATVLYENLKEGDEVVWSAGWKSATIYYFLAKQGKIPYEDLDKFPKPPYLGLAETSVPGVHVSGGSMGHGLPVAVGMALAKKKLGEEGTIYCIMSDGELNEGTTWEAAMLAAHHKLDNLVVFIDKNGWQAMGKTDEVLNLDPLGEKFNSFNWEYTGIDGHSYEHLENVIKYKNLFEKPHAIICTTVKGFGGQTACKVFEKGLVYHYKHVDEATFKEALELLGNDEVRVLS